MMQTKTYCLQAGRFSADQAPSADTTLPCGQSRPVAASETIVHLSDTLTDAPPAIQILTTYRERPEPQLLL